jgi:hypothetical protein
LDVILDLVDKCLDKDTYVLKVKNTSTQYDVVPIKVDGGEFQSALFRRNELIERPHEDIHSGNRTFTLVIKVWGNRFIGTTLCMHVISEDLRREKVRTYPE